MDKNKSVFNELIINDSEKAFKNAIKRGMNNPENWMYMYSTKFKDYFKHYYTRDYISYFNFGNMSKDKSNENDIERER